jgi:hypothetical protein
MADYERPTSSSSTVTETRSGGNGFLYFAIGALIVAVGVLAWLFYGGGLGQPQSNTADSSIDRAADRIGDAANDIGDAARDATRNVTPPPAPAPAPAQPATPPAQPTNPG